MNSSSLIQHSQWPGNKNCLETTNKWMGKEKLLHINSGIKFKHKDQWNYDFFRKWIKSFIEVEVFINADIFFYIQNFACVCVLHHETWKRAKK